MTSKQLYGRLKKAQGELQIAINDEDFLSKYKNKQLYSKINDALITVEAAMYEIAEEEL